MSSDHGHHTDTEEDSSVSSSNTIHELTTAEAEAPSNVNMDSQAESRPFGSELQRFSNDLIKSLSNFKFTEELSDENYISWSQAVSGLFRSIDLDHFITVPNHKESYLTDAQNHKTSFIITTFILNHLDSNNNLRARNHLTDPSNPHELVYDPFKCWTFLRDRHAKITEVKLLVVTKALYSCTIHRSDTLSGYLDKFENLIREFYLFRGQMSDQQSARMLISSIPTLSETTTELIHTQVVPLTQKGVCNYLREYETRQGWSSPAMREAKAAYGSP